MVVSASPAAAAGLGAFLAELDPAVLIPGADRYGEVDGDPPAVPIYRGETLLGYGFLNSDVVSSVGYSGKPIDIAIGVTLEGAIAGAKLVEHSEPIVLVGIPERKVVGFIAGYVGRDVASLADSVAGGGRATAGAVDMVSGATVTVMVIDDSIVHAALKVARSRGLGGLTPALEAAAQRGRARIDRTRSEVRDWTALIADGSVRRLHLRLADVNDAFARSGNEAAAARPERGDPHEEFIDLYLALASVPTIGRSLLGEAEYALMAERLGPDRDAVVVAAKGPYSFKGSSYVRGGIFDRLRLLQGDASVRFRDRNHKRLGEIAAVGAPRLREVGLFVIPEGTGFEPGEPWRLELLVRRATGPVEHAYITYDLAYQLPEPYLVREAPAAPAPTATASAGGPRTELWKRLWRGRLVDVTVLAVALSVLTILFFFQNSLVVRPRLTDAVRVGFLLFTVVWIGGYAQAQLSVVNVLTFTNALMTDFRWDYFLLEPLIFVLWFSVAASILFWGRGGYCGWLCPFGALQELLNRLAKLARIPQLRLPWGLHERLWPFKYMIFLLLFGLSLYSLALAERLSEIEPFKTAVVLRFMREWPYVLFAVGLLAIGLFIERFYCRYLCALGAALAIPAKLRMFEWLRRHHQCGAPCHRCAEECMVQAIHPDGHINANECLYCLNCQTLYFDEFRCPPMIKRRERRERRQALGSAAMAGKGALEAVQRAEVDAGRAAG
jgi:NosR/NirI family nitrous oxide reductase transcriptional regulator